MSTTLKERDGFYLNRFSGGAERGPCHQITDASKSGDGSYVQLPVAVAIEFAEAVLEYNDVPLDRSAYRRGLKRMAGWLGIWKDGAQLVGIAGKPLAEVEREIDAGKWD